MLSVWYIFEQDMLMAMPVGLVGSSSPTENTPSEFLNL
jgi:hypothetical protein